MKIKTIPDIGIDGIAEGEEGLTYPTYVEIIRRVGEEEMRLEEVFAKRRFIPQFGVGLPAPVKVKEDTDPEMLGADLVFILAHTLSDPDTSGIPDISLPRF